MKSYKRKQNIRRKINKIGTKKRNGEKYQKGGILLKKPYTDVTAFQYFVRNSSIKLLTASSSFGIILTASLNLNVDSPYETFTSNQFLRPVQNLIIKLVYSLIIIGTVCF